MAPDEGAYTQVKKRVSDSLSVLPKPKMRGWIHTVTVPLSLAASIVLICLANTANERWACAVYLVCSLLLFGVSALYHRIDWGKRAHSVMRRFDHCNIFLLIAGSYTPIAVSLLPYSQARNLLVLVWLGALAGILLSVFWPDAPRWLYVPIYILLGWVALGYMGSLREAGGLAVIWLLVAGGLCYSIGAVFYGLRWPGRNARYFGYHEIFHAGTVAGWTCICIAAYFAVLA